MIFVKLCGIRRMEDAQVAIEAGANALGFNFWKGTPRYISPPEAARIIATVPPSIWRVGVFVDEDPQRVFQIAAETGISALQFHGSESAKYLDQLGPYEKIKVFKVGTGFEPEQLRPYRSASAFLLDSFAAGLPGGTGKTFDWSQAIRAKEYGRIILAGGLRPQNVEEAIQQVRPWGVDVSSGVETEPGKKNPKLIQDFIEVVRRVEKFFEEEKPLTI
ncbi:MAG: phosphoribosylanthranilate isomerase [Acidobacteria bacterium]|nr:phosphoribosylanthranilate isomerase [Acidobacteriota bacterium]